MTDFKPSHVNLRGSFPPLIGTMKKTEVEMAAALLVRICHLHGDAWAPVAPKDVASTLRTDVEAGHEPFASLAGNPFFRPDMFALCALGFARWLEPENERSPVEFTEQGLEAMRRWVVVAPEASVTP
jgi:hypothetical protein